MRGTRLFRWAEEADARKACELARLERIAAERGETVIARWRCGLPFRAIAALLDILRSPLPGRRDPTDRDGVV
jgi:hypothetical protein